MTSKTVEFDFNDFHVQITLSLQDSKYVVTHMNKYSGYDYFGQSEEKKTVASTNGVTSMDPKNQELVNMLLMEANKRKEYSRQAYLKAVKIAAETPYCIYDSWIESGKKIGSNQSLTMFGHHKIYKYVRNYMKGKQDALVSS